MKKCSTCGRVTVSGSSTFSKMVNFGRFTTPIIAKCGRDCPTPTSSSKSSRSGSDRVQKRIIKRDPKTEKEVLRFYEWTALRDEKIRSFDMTQVHGVVALAVVNGEAEKRIGERLPNFKADDGFSDVVTDVLGGSDVCYNDDGEISECPEK